MESSKPVIKRVKVDITREFIKKDLDFNNLEEDILAIKETIKNLDKKPILNLTINNVDGDVSHVYEIIQKELGDLTLMIRPNFNMVDLDDPIALPSDGKIGPKELLVERLEGYGNSDVTNLATDLYELLSKGKMDESQEIIDQYFNEHYDNEEKTHEFVTEEIENEEKAEEDDDSLEFKGVLE